MKEAEGRRQEEFGYETSISTLGGKSVTV